MKIERLYSNYQEEERLYSTGNDELDELLERAFCDGYEYAQREFGRTGKTAQEIKQILKPTGNRKKYKRNILEEAEKRIEEKKEWYPEKVKKLHSGNLKERGEVLRKEANRIRRVERLPVMMFDENIKGQPQRFHLISRDQNIPTSKGNGYWDELYTTYKREGLDSSRRSLNESRKSDYKRMKKEYPDIPVA